MYINHNDGIVTIAISKDIFSSGETYKVEGDKSLFLSQIVYENGEFKKVIQEVNQEVVSKIDAILAKENKTPEDLEMIQELQKNVTNKSYEVLSISPL